MATDTTERLVHIDAYRLESTEERRALGWDDIVADPGNLLLIEWAEKAHALLPRGYRSVIFDVMDDNKRSIFWR